MKQFFAIASILLIASIMQGYASNPKKIAVEQDCDTSFNESGLFSCTIEMSQQLEDLINSDKIKMCKCSYNKRFTFFTEDTEKLKRIAQDNYIYALMSANAYDKGFQVKIPGWTRIQRLVSKHGFSADIYSSNDTKNIVIAYRGTDDLKDWRYANLDTDAKGQYEDADRVFEKVVKEYSDSKVTTVGHSLGGGLSIHVSVTHKNVDSIVFNPSPRVFISKSDIKFNNKVTIIYETGEILTAVRSMFTTLNKIDHNKYRFNYLGGSAVSEHSMPNFALCMYASITESASNYSHKCKENTLWR